MEEVIRAGQKKILVTIHALTQMNKPDRLITHEEISTVVFEGEMIEDYPTDPRGHSCLMFGWGANQRAIHVVCAPKEEYLAIITAYVPTEEEWGKDFKRRKRG